MTPPMAAYGSWKSPITADDVFARFIGLRGVQLNGNHLYWCELRPEGRTVIVRHSSWQQTIDLTPPDYNVRTRVHEYGGGDYLAVDGVVYFSNFTDQQLYRQAPGEEPQPFTHRDGMRYTDAILDVTQK